MLSVAIVNDTSPSRHFGCTLVMHEIDRHLQAIGATVGWRSVVGQRWEEQARSGPKVDALVVNGEGSIHHTARNERARSLVRIGKFAREQLGIPAFLINSTLHDIAPAELEGLRSFSAIYARDTASQAELALAGIQSHVVPDITVGAEHRQAPAARAGICATDSVISADARLLRTLARRRGWGYWPMIYRFRLSSKRWPAPDRDLAAFAKAAFGLADPVASFMDYILKRELVVTGRYHAVAYCIATQTPFVAVESNTPKISSLVRDALGATDRVVLPERLKSMPLDDLRAWSPSELERLTAFTTETRCGIVAMFRDIAAQTAAAQTAPA